MKTKLFGAAAMLCVGIIPAYSSSIDLYPRNDDINALLGGELYAQTFVATGAFAQSLTFDMQSNDFGSPEAFVRVDTQFDILVTTVVSNPGGQSSVKPGGILFQSGSMVLGANADWTSFTFALGGIPLSVGVTYAWVIDALTPNGLPNTEAGARVGAVRNSHTGTQVDDAYPQGTFLFSSGGSDLNSALASSNWSNTSPSDYRDLVFRMDFTDSISSVPGPIAGAGLPGLLAAGAAFIAWKRRRELISTGSS